ncbi:MAG: DUF1573 domain-containing protein [Rikenellaceae bacterium]
MRHILLTICFLLSLTGAFAETLKFDDKSWNFGTISEDNEAVSHTFNFKNLSSKPVVIHNIRTSCGCTLAEYSQKPISGGDSSTITVTFNPRFQGGTISKNVYIYSTATQKPIVVTIEGLVTPRKKSIQELYPYTIGEGGRIEVLYKTIPGVVKNELTISTVEYFNSSEYPIEVEFRPRRESEEFKLFFDPGVAAGGVATLEVGYFAERSLTKSRTLRDTVDIYVNGKRSDKTLYIKGVESQLY